MKYIITSLLALAISLFADVLPNWNLTTGDSSPWSHATRLTATPTSDGLLLELVAWDSNLEASGLNLDPAECGGLSFEYRAEGFSEPTSGQIFFQTEASTGYDEQKEIFLPRLNCDGEWHSIAVDAGQAEAAALAGGEAGRVLAGDQMDPFFQQLPFRRALPLDGGPFQINLSPGIGHLRSERKCVDPRDLAEDGVIADISQASALGE